MRRAPSSSSGSTWARLVSHVMRVVRGAPAGGLAACPGFTERFTRELQPWVPDEVALGVHAAPVRAAAWLTWLGRAPCGELARREITRAPA